MTLILISMVISPPPLGSVPVISTRSGTAPPCSKANIMSATISFALSSAMSTSRLPSTSSSEYPNISASRPLPNTITPSWTTK